MTIIEKNKRRALRRDAYEIVRSKKYWDSADEREVVAQLMVRFARSENKILTTALQVAVGALDKIGAMKFIGGRDVAAEIARKAKANIHALIGEKTDVNKG
jgi:hypothetical protein